MPGDTLNRRRWLTSAAALAADLGLSKTWGQSPGPPFFTLLASLDEPATGPSSADNLMSNEDSIASVMDQVRSEFPGNTVFIGVGPDQNYSLIAATLPGEAYLLDYRKKNQLLHLMHLSLIAKCPDRIDYLENFWARRVRAELKSGPNDGHSELTEKAMSLFRRHALDQDFLAQVIHEVKSELVKARFLNSNEIEEVGRIQSRLAGPGPEARFLALKMYPTIASLISMKTRSGKPGHWLAGNELFQAVRELCLQQKIYPVVGDWAGQQCLKKLADHLKPAGKKVGLVYISDVEFFLLRGNRFQHYIENLARLPLHQNSLVVRTSTREIEHPERVGGLSSTTIARPLKPFLELARAGRIRRWEDLFEAR